MTVLTSERGRVCSVCVMDDSNPRIEFDKSGRCNCCKDASERRRHEWWPDQIGRERLRDLAASLKHEGQGRRYDAMVGLSGGIDSAYLAHVAVRELGLRVLAVHVDGGWNSEPAVSNIESLVRTLDIDLYTYVVEWQEMRDIQLAFLTASVFNQDIPQDHAFFATLYRTAAKFGIRHFLSGVNFATECVVPPAWGHPSIDGGHAKAIHARFGSAPALTFPFMSLTEFLWMTRIRRQLKIHKPLNFLDYRKGYAQVLLKREYGWKDYGGKHSESRFTKFYQDVYLPKKFGFDKRRLHLSSLIVAGQLSREAALAEISKPIIDDIQAERELRFVAKKLEITPSELEKLIMAPAVDHLCYPNQMHLHRLLSALKRYLRRSKSRA